MTDIKACIFDMDGVIVNTAKYHFEAWKVVVNELGFDIDESFDEQLKGVGRMKCMDILLDYAGIVKTQDEKIAIADKKNQLFLENISRIDENEILPGVLNFLDELDAKNIPYALGSASKNAPFVLEKTKLDKRFKAVVDGNMLTKPKPDPQVFLTGAEMLGADPKQSVVFEDAFNGVEAALAGGFYCVGIGEEEILGKAHFCVSGFENMSLDLIRTKLSE